MEINEVDCLDYCWKKGGLNPLFLFYIIFFLLFLVHEYYKHRSDILS